MKSLPIGIATLALIGCTERRTEAHQHDAQMEQAARSSESLLNSSLPSPGVISHIERRLSENRCIGSIDRWFRKYAHGLDTSDGAPMVDANIVMVSLHEAGAYEFKPGRSVVRPLEWASIDDRPYRYASATYDVAGDSLVVNFCGPNAPH